MPAVALPLSPAIAASKDLRSIFGALAPGAAAGVDVCPLPVAVRSVLAAGGAVAACFTASCSSCMSSVSNSDAGISVAAAGVLGSVLTPGSVLPLAVVGSISVAMTAGAATADVVVGSMLAEIAAFNNAAIPVVGSMLGAGSVFVTGVLTGTVGVAVTGAEAIAARRSAFIVLAVGSVLGDDVPGPVASAAPALDAFEAVSTVGSLLSVGC